MDRVNPQTKLLPTRRGSNIQPLRDWNLVYRFLLTVGFIPGLEFLHFRVS